MGSHVFINFLFKYRFFRRMKSFSGHIPHRSPLFSAFGHSYAVTHTKRFKLYAKFLLHISRYARFIP